MIAICLYIILISLVIWNVYTYKKIALYKTRLIKKDQLIHMLIIGLPALFVENFPDMKDDASFVFYSKTRPEYDGKFIEIKWICEGQEKQKYNSLVLKYFKFLQSIGLEVHPVLLQEKPYNGRIMLESYYDFNENETLTEKELEQSVRRTKNI